MKNIKLIMIDPSGNHNKYYNLKELPGGSMFEVYYGRVGAAGQRKNYPMNRWNDVLEQKIKKGYRDVTTFHEEESPFFEVDRYKKIEEKSVRELMENLIASSSNSIQKNYNISDREVTESMIREAQRIITSIGYMKDPVEVNKKLLQLYSVIPRKMHKVDEFMCNAVNEIKSILIREQDVLDIMAAKVNYNLKLSNPTSDKTICEELGIEIRPVSIREQEQIKKHLNDENSDASNFFKRAWRIHNQKTDDRFYSLMNKNGYGNQDVHYLFHGSRNRNWLGIVSEGLSLNPNAPITGKMFGFGLYFASSAKKSIGYTSLSGSRWAGGSDHTAYLAVYKVLYSNPLDVYSHKSEYCTYRGLSDGKDALFAHKGSMLYNDEIVIYNENQATLQYLIELEKN